MRYASKIIGLLALILLMPGPATVYAAGGAIPDAPAASQIKPASAAKITIKPHRAIYKMSLASVKNGSSINGVSGQMLFEWADVCDGWAVQQHLQLHFSYSEGDESDINSTVLSWESKDGRRYNFNVRRTTDGKETEAYRGKATLAADGSGTVVYTLPSKKTVKLAAGTIFPSAHTEILLRKAMAGDRLFTRRVFDGSDKEGLSDISAFIESPQAYVQTTEMNPDLKSNPLVAQTTWPIRMAFYKPDTKSGEPDYEMNLDLLANGVARRMVIDYGDFSVSGILSEIEALPASGC